jgi:hypothetical protein
MPGPRPCGSAGPWPRDAPVERRWKASGPTWSSCGPALPMVLAQEQAEAIAAVVGQSPSLRRPPLDLLLVLAAPSQPDDTVPAP